VTWRGFLGHRCDLAPLERARRLSPTLHASKQGNARRGPKLTAVCDVIIALGWEENSTR
jgi:hypothetical protein